MLFQKNEELFSHPSHPHHPLKLFKSLWWRRNCDCCCEEMSIPGYACESAYCRFYLHKSCAELAQEISHPLHHHPLNLLSEIPKNNFNGIICDGCRNLYKKGFTYYCSWSCGFNLHPKCDSKHDHDELLQQQTFNKELTLYHFCHKHALNFCNLRESNEKDCCCCKQRISGSAYCCLECEFFIHESCKEIPKQVQHPFHPQHILLAQAMDDDAFMTRCDACRSSINGVRISCNM